MKVSELYNNYENEVDQLQKAINHHVRDQGSLCLSLAEKQDKMRRLAAIMINEGDRLLTGVEIVALQPADAPTKTDVAFHFAKETLLRDSLGNPIYLHSPKETHVA